MSIDSCQSLTSVTRRNRRLRVVCEYVYKRVAQDGPVRKYGGQLGSIYACMQLTSLQFDMGNPFYGQLTAVSTIYPLTTIT